MPEKFSSVSLVLPSVADPDPHHLAGSGSASEIFYAGSGSGRSGSGPWATKLAFI
jgi:hypothetical protein